MPFSLPIGIYNVAYGRWMCQERWGWGHHWGCTHWATQNRPWFRGWEEMHLVRVIPLSQGNNNEYVYIILCEIKFDKEILNNNNFNKMVNLNISEIENKFINKYSKIYNLIRLSE